MIKHKLGKRSLMLSAAISMLLCSSAFAADPVELDLQEAMERAFETNPAISIAGYERDSARANLNAARQSKWISISVNHSTKRGGYDDEIQDKNGAWSKNIGNDHANGVTASMPIYTGGKLSGTIKRAKAGYIISEVGVQKAYNDMRTTVTTGYFDVLQAGNMQQLGRESVTRLEDHLKNVQAQYDVGVVAKIDVLRSQVELANAQQDLIKAENAYQLAEAQLNKIVGLPLETSLKLDDILVYAPYGYDMAYCLGYAAVYRPELEQAKQSVEAARGSLTVARSGHMPQVAASASQKWSDSNWPGDENGNWGVGVTVNMNVFDTGVTMSKIHGAEADLAKAEETYRDTVDSVNLDVRSNYLSLREAEKRIDTTKLAVDQADEDYRIAQLRYRSGVGTNTDVLDAEVALTKAKTNYLQAMYDYNTSKVTLENAMGVPMKFPVKTTVEAKRLQEAEKAVDAAEEAE